MPLLASDCMDESAGVYLNDPLRQRWPYSVLLPYLKSAYFELQTELEANDLPPIHEYSAILTVTPGTVQLASPSDMVLPIRLEERSVGETRWTPMEETGWEPDADPDSNLSVWVFREGLVQFLGATTTRQVRLRYIRTLGAIGSEGSSIELPQAKGFLAARTAGLAATFGGHATQRGDAANARGNYFLQRIIQGLTNREQDRPVRRRRYPWRQLRQR